MYCHAPGSGFGVTSVCRSCSFGRLRDVEGAICVSDGQNLLKFFRRGLFALTAAKSSNAADRRVAIITLRSLVD